MSAASRYIQLQPLSAATDGNFQASLQFQYTIPTGKALAAYESYLSVSIQSNFNNTNTTVGSSNDTNTAICVNSNPVSCLFSKMTHKINDVTVSNVDLVPITSTMMTLVSYNKPTLKSVASANPIYIIDKRTGIATRTVYDTVNAAGADTALNDLRLGNVSMCKLSQIKSKAEAIRCNGLEQPTAFVTQVRYNWVPSFGTFSDSDVMIPGNTRHNFEFTIDSNWFRQLFHGYLDTAADPVSGFTCSNNTAGFVNGQINSLIKSVVLYLSIHDVYDTIPPTVSIPTTESYTSTKSLLSQNDRIAFNIPSGVKKILVGFVDSRYGSSTMFSPTCFCMSSTYAPPGLANPADATNPREPPLLEQLREVGISFAGENYPSFPYDFPSGLVPTANANETEDVYRAFQDFLVATDSFADAGGSIYDWQTWAANPIFAFRITTPQGDMSRDLTVHVRTGAPVANVLCCVVCLYDKNTVITYTPQGVVSGVKSEDQM